MRHDIIGGQQVVTCFRSGCQDDVVEKEQSVNKLVQWETNRQTANNTELSPVFSGP